MFDLQFWNIAWMAVRRVFKKNRSPDDDLLDHWLDLDHSHRELLQEYPDPDTLIKEAIEYGETDIATAWDHLAELDPSLGTVSKERVFPGHRNQVKRLPRYLRVAAVVISILITLAGLGYPLIKAILNHSSHMTTKIHLPPTDTFATKPAWLRPGDFQLTLIVPDQRNIDAATLPQKDTSIYNKVIVQREGQGTLVYKTFHPPGKKIAVFTLTTPRGGWYIVKLPDRTQITLNAATTVSFTSGFGTTDRTLILLDGEACVHSHPRQRDQSPLLVKLAREGIAVRVLSDDAWFNITAYKEDSDIRITVLKGTLQAEDSATAGKKDLSMGLQYRINGRDKPQLIPADTAEAVAWTHGAFDFKKRTIREIMRPIARWYNAVVDYDNPPIKTYTFNGIRAWDIERTRNAIQEMGGMNLRIDSNHIQVTR